MVFLACLKTQFEVLGAESNSFEFYDQSKYFIAFFKKHFTFILLSEEDKSSAGEQLFSNKISNGNISIS